MGDLFLRERLKKRAYLAEPGCTMQWKKCRHLK